MNIDKVISNATQIYTNDTSSTPIVSYYHGIEGIKEVYKDTLSLTEGDYLYAFLNPEVVHPDLYSWLTTEYVKMRVEKNILAHVFVTKNDSEKIMLYKDKDKEENRITHIVESFNFPFESEVNIYGDKVAFINYNPNDELIGVIINHKTIVKTLKAFYLHYLWKI